jgi:exonuclease SbcC
MKIKLHNIQGHKNSVFEVHSGLNVIVGSTDVGKSTIIRALRWLVFNKPAGEILKRNGTSKMYVEITTDEGDVVRRERGKENLYIVNGEVFKAFGSRVPAEVSDVLNLSLHNFKHQHAPFFLLSDSGPERARILNQFMNLDRITETCNTTSKEVREEKSHLKFLWKDMDTITEFLVATTPLYSTALEVKKLVEEGKAAEKVISRSKSLDDDINSLCLLERGGAILSEAAERLSDGLTECERLIVQVKRYDVACGHEAALNSLKEMEGEMKQQVTDIKKKIKALDRERCSTCGRLM